MPTFNRRAFVPLAIRYFLSQDYANKELIVIDDGTDSVSDLMPTDERIRYVRLTARKSIGAKRNLACQEGLGEFIVHWDDDDWSAAWRLRYQIEALGSGRGELCGLSRVWFYDLQTDRTWQYQYQGNGRPWVCGGTLAFAKTLWQQHPFPDNSVGEDTRFVWSQNTARVVALENPDFYVAMIHPANTSPKRIRQTCYRPFPNAAVHNLLGADIEALRAVGQAVAPLAEAPQRGISSSPGSSTLPARVSVVVPHGGRDRLRNLAATLANLRQQEIVGEIIVAEMGEAPLAWDLAKRWADKFVFVRQSGPFERARLLNAGTWLAENDLILWSDNDLLFPEGFLRLAVHELRERNLDYLIPYTAVVYLSAQDTEPILQGTRNPLDCRAVNALYARSGMCGAAGLVRREFLQRVGGLCEFFLGWGGEDDAWAHKARLLGRSDHTAAPNRFLPHLFHPGSGGYDFAKARHENPMYTKNLALLREMLAIRDGKQLLARFPAPNHFTCPWPRNRRILLVRQGDNPLAGFANTAVRALEQLFGIVAEITDLPPATSSWANLISAHPPDALVLAATDSVACASAFAPIPWLAKRTVAILPADLPPSAELIDALGQYGAILTSPGAAAVALRTTNLPLWIRTGRDEPGPAGAALAQPLSLILAGADIHRQSSLQKKPDPAPISLAETPILPVWTYWEGPCPDWIQACRQTLLRFAPGLRVLSPDSFAALWDLDKDLPLSGLGAAHRADFVRAFLLARYGGLWVDSDCLLMQPLSPLLNELRDHDFLAHRERTGIVSNAFIGARPGSMVAAEFYQRVCAALRSGRPLGWIALGGEPLTELVSKPGASWLELPVEVVQPVCWSQPCEFFREANDPEHELNLQRASICYMLSNQQVSQYQARHPGANLLKDKTFFSFLLRHALQQSSRPTDELPRAIRHQPVKSSTGLLETFAHIYKTNAWHGDESISGPGSSLEMTAEIRSRLPLLMADLGVRTLLDAACGDFHWLSKLDLRLDSFWGVDVVPELRERNVQRHSAPGREFLTADITRDPLPKADLILCRDCLGHFPTMEICRTLRNFQRSGAQWLLMTTFTRIRPYRDLPVGGWQTVNFQIPPFNLPEPSRLVVEHCSEGGGAYADKSLGLWHLPSLRLQCSQPARSLAPDL
jgi:hypothetical protein